MRRAHVYRASAMAIGAGLVWLLFFALPKWSGPSAPVEPAETGKASEAAGRKIKATLFYVSGDGRRLVAAEREVPYAAATADQARQILEEQLKPAPAPLVSAVPAGTTVRTVFVTDRGDAFVDFSREVVTAHTGGSLDELFTVYSIVNAVTANLPAVSAVQVLVDGREVETLAGHVDLRHPLRKNLKWTGPG
ncbi:MAG: GerMN domain-containing protein [Acidobacteria bacterium]|nr:GerMN domain-containing protein [Acidobacteriota bacterium]